MTKTNPSMSHKKFYGIIVDVNPIEHWGGVVYDQGNGPALLYFQSYDGDSGDDDDDSTMVSVYNVFIEDDVVEDLSWVDWDAVARTNDMDVAELKRYAKDPNVLARADVYATVASHYGWSQIDDGQEMTLKQAEKKYGRMVDAAHRAQNKPKKSKSGNPSSALKNKLLR